MSIYEVNLLFFNILCVYFTDGRFCLVELKKG